MGLTFNFSGPASVVGAGPLQGRGGQHAGQMQDDQVLQHNHARACQHLTVAEPSQIAKVSVIETSTIQRVGSSALKPGCGTAYLMT